MVIWIHWTKCIRSGLFIVDCSTLQARQHMSSVIWRVNLRRNMSVSTSNLTWEEYSQCVVEQLAQIEPLWAPWSYFCMDDIEWFIANLSQSVSKSSNISVWATGLSSSVHVLVCSNHWCGSASPGLLYQLWAYPVLLLGHGWPREVWRSTWWLLVSWFLQ
jgi:hypothetical protein